MTNIESKPPVIDFDALFQPISEENPSGENMRLSDLYDDVKEARRADEELPMGQWQTDLKKADFPKVITLAVSALSTQTKDLQIGAWLTEALVKENGFAGLRDGLKLMSGLQDKFWETVFPQINEGDMVGRANAIAWLDTQIAFAVKGSPITGEGYGFADFEDSKRYDIPESIDTLDSADQAKYRELQAEAEARNKVTADKWRKAKAATRRVFYEELNLTVEECWTEFNELNRVIEERFDPKQAPGLSSLKKALDDIQTQVKKLLEEKRAEEPDAANESAEAPLTEGENEAAGGAIAVAANNGAIRTRQDALKRLDELSEYFRKNEPQSPISYLIQRAVKWGNMPFEVWLQDVIKDETVLFQLRQTLGFNTKLPDSEQTNPQ
jgi:type VI secretion system protein ImpA